MCKNHVKNYVHCAVDIGGCIGKNFSIILGGQFFQKFYFSNLVFDLFAFAVTKNDSVESEKPKFNGASLSKRFTS
jgi:hypothetical protein